MMISSTQFTQAALMLNEAQERISKYLGVTVLLSFEIETHRSMTPANVHRVVSQVSGVPLMEMNSRSKIESVCYARYVCFWLMRKYIGMTLKSIGEYFGRDHSTVISGLDVIENESNNIALQDLLVQSEKTFLKQVRYENQV